jgi:hypothetical protein
MPRSQWEVHSFGDATQDAADTATAQAQHQAAIDAYNARQVGDQAAYAAAIQRLYALGYTNAASATQADLLTIANSAGGAGALASVETFLKVGLGLFGLYLVLQLVRAVRGGRAHG